MRRALFLSALLPLAAACHHRVVTGPTPAGGAATVATSMSTSTTVGPAEGWRSLNSLDAWRGYKMQAAPPEWHATPDGFEKTASTEDLITRDQFGDFELALDWKLTPGGNAGIFYHATEAGEKVYETGPEYQLLDDERHPDGKNRLTSAGADYGLYAPPAGVVKPAGEWNSTRIVIRGPHVEHWLNGQKVVEYELWSPDWEAKVKASKFAQWPGYGRAKRGYIGIQGDHAGMLSIRNVRIRELP
jgi:hypothetical protein